MPTLPPLFDDPVALAVLTLVIAVVAMWQRALTWPEYRQAHRLKRRVLPLVDRYTSLFVVSRKGGRDDAEFFTTATTNVRQTFQRLRRGGGSPHLINSIKVRTHPDTGERQYSDAHLVWTHSDGTQTEAYLFANGDGTTDVYAHHEFGVRDPEKHYETGGQRDGDVRGVVAKALLDTVTEDS